MNALISLDYTLDWNSYMIHTMLTKETTTHFFSVTETTRRFGPSFKGTFSVAFY